MAMLYSRSETASLNGYAKAKQNGMGIAPAEVKLLNTIRIDFILGFARPPQLILLCSGG